MRAKGLRTATLLSEQARNREYPLTPVERRELEIRKISAGIDSDRCKEMARDLGSGLYPRRPLKRKAGVAQERVLRISGDPTEELSLRLIYASWVTYSSVL